MRGKYHWLIAGFLLCFAGRSPGADALPDAKALLYEAKEVTTKTSFVSEIPVYRNGKLQKTVKLYRKALEDGTVLSKQENLWRDSQPEICITNSSGNYVIQREQKIMKVPVFVGARSVITFGVKSSFDNQADYSIVDEPFRRIPCYKVSVKLPKDQTSLTRVEDSLKKKSDIADDYLTTKVPFERAYWIGKDNKFIFSCEYYNFNGEKIYSWNWGKIDLKTPIDSGIFNIPEEKVEEVSAKEIEKINHFRQLFFIPSMITNTAAQTAEPAKDDPQDILFSAMRNTQNSFFKATLPPIKGTGNKRTVTTWHQPLPDGSIREYEQYSWPDTWKETYVMTGSDNYAVINNAPIKTNFKVGSKRYIYDSVRKDVAEDAAYAMTNGSYNGDPCYVITVKIPTDKEYVKQRVAKIQRYSNKTEEEILAKLPFAKTFLVSKKKNFIYSCTSYNLLGRRIEVNEWGNVTFDPPVDETLFAVPQGQMHYARTMNEFERFKARCLALFKESKLSRKGK